MTKKVITLLNPNTGMILSECYLLEAKKELPQSITVVIRKQPVRIKAVGYIKRARKLSWKGSAPFAQFPDELRSDIDVLHITEPFEGF